MAEGPAKLARFVAWDKALLTVSESSLLRTRPIDPLAHLNRRGFRPLTEDERGDFGIAGDAPEVFMAVRIGSCSKCKFVMFKK
jgi:hypothetical protein